MNKVVVGAQWGDEGKAKITDLLAGDADLIIRYQGGCNAGHTVVAHNKTFKFHLIPSGILYKGKTCFIGAGTVILPEYFEEEIQGLIKEGIDVSGLKINPLASITMPYHTEDVYKRQSFLICNANSKDVTLSTLFKTSP